MTCVGHAFSEDVPLDVLSNKRVALEAKFYNGLYMHGAVLYEL
jgi:hypothetical protein